jgi:hypothetical protein
VAGREENDLFGRCRRASWSFKVAHVGTAAAKPNAASMHESVRGNVPPQPYSLQDPDSHCHHDHYIQNGLDASSHRDVGVDQPQQDSDDN